MKSNRKIFSGIIILSFLFSFCSKNEVKSIEQKEFECLEYWIPKNIKWKISYDDVLYSNSNLILMSKNSSWGINVSGSLHIIQDTIYTNQENGIENKCILLKKPSFLNDSTLIYSGIEYIKSSQSIEHGCWCKWEN